MALQPDIFRNPRVSSTAAPAGRETALMPDELGVKKPPTAIRSGSGRFGDRLFKGIATAAGATIVAAIALIAIFLLIRAVPSLAANHANFFTSAKFDTADAGNLQFGIRDLFMVTVLSSVFALALAVPVAIGIALFLTHYAPARLSRPLSVLVDLLAAVPSIVFGLWGIFVLGPHRGPA